MTSYAHLGGDSGTMICRTSSTSCTLNCKATGCKGLEYICENGANCLIDPPQCDGNRNTFRGIDCPTRTNTAFVDQYMEKKHEMRKDIYNAFDQYIEEMMNNNGDYDEDYHEEFMMKLDEKILIGDVGLITAQSIDYYNKQVLIGIGCIAFVVLAMICLFYKTNKTENGYQAI